MIDDKAEEVIKKLFDSLIKKYQIGLEKSVKVSDFIYDCVHLLFFKCHKINFKQGGSYIDSPVSIKIKKATNSRIKS